MSENKLNQCSFCGNHKDVVKKGETHLIDKAMYIDGVLQCVYIKGETNYIYFDGGDDVVRPERGDQ